MAQLSIPQAQSLVVPGPSPTRSEDDDRPPDTSARALQRTAVLRPLRPRAVINRLPLSDAANQLRLRLFPGTSKAEWNDWRWQVRNRIRDLAALERVFRLSDAEREAVRRHTGSLPVGITPYYASLMDAHDPDEALRRTHVPTLAEFERMPGEADDPLGEDHDTVVPGLVHRYPDRVLFLATPFCSTYCRYCTRARMVGESGEYSFGVSVWEQALAYLERHEEVRDVLISGGDPLALKDDKLDWLLTRLRRIPHIEFVRIGTKMPAVLPMRITRELTAIARRHRVWMSIHFTHPNELTPEVAMACDRLADAGIPLGSQTVLLKGINDDVQIMRRLMLGLLKNRVRPYYIYQCDPISGSGHFRTTVDKGLEIIRGLRGYTTGYAVPTFVVDAPGGGGKIPLIPDPVVGRDGEDLLLRNFEGGVFRYPDAGGTLGRDGGR
jgi:lysine 2,3-aminomutase